MLKGLRASPEGNIKFLEVSSFKKPQIGLAFSPGAQFFLKQHPELVDYIEIPFEVLRHDPSLISIQDLVPIILHCASMSIAGFIPPTIDTLETIEREAYRTRTPWIGEHLAFITADPLEEKGKDDSASAISLSYTVCPQFSEATLQNTCSNVAALQGRLQIPLIIENSPQYFIIPGSTMSIVDFMVEFYRMCNVGLLLDLTHFMISSINMGFDPYKEVERLPLERVVEIHISGFSMQSGIAWDDHSRTASEQVFKLLEQVLRRAQPQALTFEYNWSPIIADQMLASQITRVREMMPESCYV